jgi:hypothetical protein
LIVARFVRLLVIGGVAVVAGALSEVACVDNSEVSICDRGAGTPTGRITTPATTTQTPVTIPYTVSGVIDYPGVAVDYVTVAGVPATATDTNFSVWTAQLGKDVLEANRMGDDAQIVVKARTVCSGPNDETTIATQLVPIGPNPQTPITGLTVTIDPPSGDSCYLPANGSAATTVEISADMPFARASVNVAATNGVLSPSGSVTLNPSAKYDLFLTGSAQGTAVVTASSGGVTAASKSILVAAAPLIANAGGSAVRGVDYSLYVTSLGKLLDCRAEASDPSTVTLTATGIGAISTTGTTSVKAANAPDCSVVTTLQIDVLFMAAAADGAEVTLSCRDTYLQEGSATVTVAPDGGI